MREPRPAAAVSGPALPCNRAPACCLTLVRAHRSWNPAQLNDTVSPTQAVMARVVLVTPFTVTFGLGSVQVTASAHMRQGVANRWHATAQGRRTGTPQGRRVQRVGGHQGVTPGKSSGLCQDWSGLDAKVTIAAACEQGTICGNGCTADTATPPAAPKREVGRRHSPELRPASQTNRWPAAACPAHHRTARKRLTGLFGRGGLQGEGQEHEATEAQQRRTAAAGRDHFSPRCLWPNCATGRK